jgi:signal transduction histidine kinase
MTSTPDLSRLLGVRSGKKSFYPEYRGAAQRLERVVHALELISRALVRTVEGPETLVCAVAEAARAHLNAQWLVFALCDGAIPEAGMRMLVLGPGAIPYLVDNVEGPDLPPEVGQSLLAVRAADVGAEPLIERDRIFVPVVLDGGVVGAFVVWPPKHRIVDSTDTAVLSILASQTAVALQNSALFEQAQQLLASSENAYEQARRTAADLAVRNAELEVTQRELGAAYRRQLLEEERHRIARELHDSVTQTVLSVGMQIEVCRNTIPATERTERLDLAKNLTRQAVEQLRSAIYALGHSRGAQRSSLPELLRQLSEVHMPDDLRVSVQVQGAAVELPGEVEHAVLRIAGEALFNTAVHAHADRAVLRLKYGGDAVELTVDDDGTGDPGRIRTKLRLAARGDLNGSHRGLANMQARARDFGGELSVRRARLGGVRIGVRIPLPTHRVVERHPLDDADQHNSEGTQ